MVGDWRMNLRAHTKLTAVTLSAALWLAATPVLAAPVLSISVNGGPDASFEYLTSCDEDAGAFSCVGSGSEGDLLVDLYELSADPGAYLAGSFSFYNTSATETLSVLATVVFPMTGSFATPTLSIGTGVASPVGADVDLTVNGFVDYPSVALLTEASCTVLSYDTGGCSSSAASASLNVLANIGFSLAFDLAPDTALSIGFDPESSYGAGSYFAISPAVVPVPAAAWLFLSAIAAALPARRKMLDV
jgi:hypothetical protein